MSVPGADTDRLVETAVLAPVASQHAVAVVSHPLGAPKGRLIA